MNIFETALQQFDTWMMSLSPQHHVLFLAAGLVLMILAIVALLLQKTLSKHARIDHAAVTRKSNKSQFSFWRNTKDDAFLQRLENLS